MSQPAAQTSETILAARGISKLYGGLRAVDDLVGTLIAVMPSTGADRVVSAAPKLALALGYDIDAALEA